MIRLPPHVNTVLALLRQHQGDGRPIGDALADVDWPSALRFANDQLVTPELHAAVQALGYGELLPTDVADYLAYLHDLNRIRNECMRAQLIEVIKAWNDAGLMPMVLKGGVGLLENYDSTSCRMMADLDVLFDPAEVRQAVTIAEAVGYRIATVYQAGRHDYACMVRSEEPASLDLHIALIDPGHLLPAEGVRHRATSVSQNGINVLIPSPQDQVLHMVLHDMVHHGAYRSGIIWLRRLTDLARMVKAHRTMDGAAMLATLERHGAEHVLRAQAHAARQLIGLVVPGLAAGGPAAKLFVWRGVTRWRRHPAAGDEPPLLRLFLSGLAYRWDPAASMMPFSVKLVRRLLFGWEPPPWESATGSAPPSDRDFTAALR